MVSRKIKKELEDLRNTQELLIKTISNLNDFNDSVTYVLVALTGDYRWRMDNDKQKEVEDFVKRR